MIRVTVQLAMQTARVLKAVDTGLPSALKRAGGSVRLIARRSIRSGRRSTPGQPPKTSTRRLRNAIAYELVDGGTACVVGPAHPGTPGGEYAGAHERGGAHLRRRYPARPFMHPALVKGQRYVLGAFKNFLHR